MYHCVVIGVESLTMSHTFAVIFAATAPHSRWRWKPCNGLLVKRIYIRAFEAKILELFKIIQPQPTN